MFIENFRQNDNIALRSRFVNMRFSLFDENQWISDRERSPAEKSAAGADAGGFAVLTCVERRGPLCPIASGDRLLCRNALRQRHGFGDARPLRGAVFLRVRATDRVRCAAKFHFADAAVSLRVQSASGGQGASPLEPDRRGAGAGGGFAALTRLTDNVLCLYSRSEYGTLRKKNFRTESIARYSFSSPSSAKPCG